MCPAIVFNVSSEITIPIIFYDKLEVIKNRTGLGEKKVCRYLFNNALFDECYKANITTIIKCFKGKFHCENALFNPEIMISELDKIFDK